jgi:hypothetical protein
VTFFFSNGKVLYEREAFDKVDNSFFLYQVSSFEFFKCFALSLRRYDRWCVYYNKSTDQTQILMTNQVREAKQFVQTFDFAELFVTTIGGPHYIYHYSIMQLNLQNNSKLYYLSKEDVVLLCH